MAMIQGLYQNDDQIKAWSVEEWKKVLTKEYLDAWKEWVKKRDIVAQKMNLRPIHIKYLTLREITRFATFSIKRELGLNEQTKEKVVNTRGTTNALRVGKIAKECFQVYSGQCDAMMNIKKFDEEISKTTLKR